MSASLTNASPPTRAKLVAQSCAVYLAFVAVAVTLLHFNPVRLIDYEELDYGELPIALVDGLVSFDNLASFQTFPREGSLLFWAPLVAGVFALLGPSLFSLKLAGILIGGLWAAAWYAVTRRAVPTAHPWLIGLAFAIPVPLIQISSISATSAMAHFGSSLWHAASLLATFLAVARSGRRATRAAVLAGLSCGLGLYCGYSILPLVPGFLWVFARTGRLGLLRPWLFGTLPGLALTAGFLAETALEGVDKGVPARYAIDLAHKLIFYGAGVYVGGERIHPKISVFSSVAVAYPLLLAVVAALASRSASRSTFRAAMPRRAVEEGAAISCAGTLGALWVMSYTVDLWAFDGLRYLIPLAAPLTLLLVAFAARLPRPGPGFAVGTLVALNAAAYASLLSPLEPAEYLHSSRGYRGSFFLHASYSGPLLDLPVPADRASHYALWMGAAETMRGRLDVEMAREEAAFPSGEAQAEFFRGVGLGRAVRLGCIETGQCVPEGTPASLTDYVWQGVGLASDCGIWRGALTKVPPSARGSYLWGLGRGSFQDCEDWPRDPAFAAGANSSIIDQFALTDERDALRLSTDSRPLSLYAAPELNVTVARLFDHYERTDWWLR